MRGATHERVSFVRCLYLSLNVAGGLIVVLVTCAAFFGVWLLW